jgi:type I restriction enzyme S subunit
MNDELPEGWTLVALATLCTFNYGTSAKSAQTGEVPVLRMGNIQNGEIDWSDLVFTSNPAEIARFTLKPNTVLFNRTNSPELVGKTAIYRGERPAVFAGYLIRINPVVELDPKYLNFFLNSHMAKEFCIQVKTDGVSQSNINATKLGAFEIPICPPSEQHRIVAKLDALLATVQSCKRRLDKIPSTLKRFRQAVLAAACAGRLTADWRAANGETESGWRDMQLADVCRSIADGDHQPPPQRSNGIPFLTIGNLAAGKLEFAGTRFVSEEYFAAIKPHRKPVRGDVLYSVVATIGIPVLVETNRPFCFQRHIAILKANEQIIPRYLRLLLGSPAVVNEGRAKATGTAQPTLSLGSLRAIPVRIPPVTEQAEIVRQAEAMFALADRLEARYAKAKAHVERITPSLLAKGFRGELVPTEAELAKAERRPYETAEQLLARVKGQQNGDKRAKRYR